MGVIRNLYYLDRRPGVNKDFTRGEERWLLWAIRRKRWMKFFPYRTYPMLPFSKTVTWHLWGSKWRVTLPRPWAKDLFAELHEGEE